MIARILFDGLWQGAAIVVIAYLVTRGLPRRNATTRYAVWFAALLALVAIPIFSALSNAGALLLTALQPHVVSSGWKILLLPAGPLAQGATGSIAPATRWVLGFWAAGTGFFFLRLCASMLRIDSIRHNAALVPTAYGDVLASPDVPIPIAIGFVNPAVVIPNRLLETLAPADLERIVAHERAHVRRGDVAGNLLQRLVEAFLFFNPWVHLIGRNLVLEREAACDDWAVQKTGAPAEYAACLAALAQSLRHPRAPLATPSALGSRHALVERIERLGIASHAITLNYYVIGGTVMLFVILTLALEALSPAQASAPAQSASQPASSGTSVALASCPNPNASAKYVDGAPPNLPHGLTVAGSASVLVIIGSNGRVLRADMSRSSANAQIDQAVFDAAAHGKYSPKLVNCAPVKGKYLFQVDFKPDPQR